ncbi:HlyD family secretion protein [Neorhodopirellula pilleata]|uniref:Multidrug resistance protein MdtN n=1 Tax=Neorhodopirellula pilleata TaxID=2714738 RepID=A0A5C6A3Z3_9BACT|nr:HlyD family efflux transporter periplasmic adaptor subunit [Neorhodopirellula pilleata]TWT93143.1 multidrug resistance protein MdtN [Neorhodopirellula pilleata]
MNAMGWSNRFLLAAMLTLGFLASTSTSAQTTGQDPPTRSSGDSVVARDVVVDFAGQVDVPARTSGPVAVLPVQRNQWVRSGDLLAQLDDSQTVIRRRAAALKEQAARLVIQDSVEIRYAETALAEAEAELDDGQAASERVSGAVARNQLRRMKLAVERAQLELARAEKERRQAEIDLQLRAADLAVIDHELAQLKCVAPIEGVVLEVHREPGEWVHAGEPLVTIADAAVLHLHSLVHADELDPARCVGLPVSVQWTKVDPSSGEDIEQSLRGKVLSVDPTRLSGNRFRLHAEVANRRNVTTNSPLEADGWQLSPGMDVTMTIHRGQAETAWRAERARSGSLR